MANGNSRYQVTGSLGLALLGAALGAATVILSDRQTRRRFITKVKDIMDKSEAQLNRLQEKAQQAATTGKKRIAEELDRTRRRLDTDTQETKAQASM